MTITEAFFEALKSGNMTISNCQFVITNEATLGDFYAQQAASSRQPINEMQSLDPKLKSEKAIAMLKKLVENQYCHVQGSCYIWDGKQADYGYMVYIMSGKLEMKHPSSDRIQWKCFHALFLNAKEMEPVAKVAVSNNISPYDNCKGWNNDAKKLKNILDL